MLLVSTGVWTSAHLAEQRKDDQLIRLADRAVDAIVGMIAPSAKDSELPILSAIERANLSEQIQGLLGAVHYLVNLSTKGIASDWSILIGDDHRGAVSQTASASRLLNARDGLGLIVILEVRLIVWDD